MGSGRYDVSTYNSTVGSTLRSGGATAAFAHSTSTMTSMAREDWVAHEDLDPIKAIAGIGSPLEGERVRESRDIDDKVSTPVAVLFDVTGSMRRVPQELASKLPALFGLLQMKGYVPDPQVMFGGIGDATCDRVPLQIGQFEADNRADTALTNLLLEGGGGGQDTESYELAMYFIARHVQTDAWDKRQHKGYLFIIGDERTYPVVKADEVRKFIGDDLEENISTPAIVAELQAKWEVVFIIPGGSSHYDKPTLLEHWAGLLQEQNVIKVPDLSTIAETIAVRVGIAEEAIDLAQGLQDLRDLNTSDDAVASVEAALSA